MNELIDFSECSDLLNDYEGKAEKFPIVYNGERYMLKFGEAFEEDERYPDRASYANVPVNEYLVCHIIETLGIPAQETLLGTYKGRSVVACKDFIAALGRDYRLYEFKKFENSMRDGSSSGATHTPEYEKVNRVLAGHPHLEPIRDKARRAFWETLVIDALVGNFDRHSGNWGYIGKSDEGRIVDVAPVYDCGSTLYPRLSEEAMQRLTGNRNELAARIRVFPKVMLVVNGKKPDYHEFLLSDEGVEGRKALLDLYPRIDLNLISESVIADTPGISDVRKDFYRALLEERKRVILEPAYKQALAEAEGQKRERTPETIAKAAREAAAKSASAICDPSSKLRP